MAKGIQYVAPPLPLPGRAGSLLAAAHTPTEPITRNFVPLGYRAAGGAWWALLDPCGPGRADHAGDDLDDVVQAWPFTIDVEETCSTFGLDDLQARAEARMAAVESAAIGRELWTGELATEADHDINPRLAAGAAVRDLAPGGAVKGKTAIGLLEQALAGAFGGELGAIHVTPSAFAFLPAPTASGDLLLTQRGTRVVADAGYPGTGPDGADPAAGESWVYATARPSVRRGPIVTDGPPADAIASVNELTYTAQRDAWVAFPGSVFAVRLIITEGD